MTVPHPKWGKFFLTFVEGDIIGVKENYREIRLGGFDYKLFEEEEGVGGLYIIYGYQYLNNLIYLWPLYWVERISKTNESVGDSNQIQKLWG